MSREAMQMALEALEDANDVARMEFSDENYYSEAINALRQALVDADDTSQELVDEKAKREHEWVGLTDDEIYDCEEEVGMPQYEISSADLYAFAQAIEQALKEKNHG
jgi:hypothetical protein